MIIRVGITDVSGVDGVVSWESGAAVDGDGSPFCYAPLGSALRGLDALGNAGKPGDWWGLACDDAGEPYIQAHDDPAPGYYISTTALADRGLPDTNPRKYVNSEKVPYVSVPRILLKAMGVKLGDFALVERNDKSTGAIVADVGPPNEIGEISIFAAKQLGIPDSPRNGGVSRGVKYTIFCNTASSPAWPRFDVNRIAREIAKTRLRCN